MNFVIRFVKPICEIDKEIGPGILLSRAMKWLEDQGESPVGVFGVIDSEDQVETTFTFPAEVENWKLPQLWEAMGFVEKATPFG